MGKRSLDPNEDEAEAVKSLFGINNPFRRKAQQDAIISDAGNRTHSAANLGLGRNSCAVKKETIIEGKIYDTDNTDVRNRKRDRRMIAATPNGPADELPIPRKRKKLVIEAEVDDLKKEKKRKRDEVEVNYEKRKYGSLGEDQPAAMAVTAGEKRKAGDAVENRLDSKESFDDESKLLRTVFIGNLPLKVKRKALNREFLRFGEIESVRIRSVPLVDTKVPRKAAVIRGQVNEEINSVNAYIVFKEEQSAHTALSLNMTQVGGNHIRVDMACRPRKKMKGEAQLYDRKRTAFIGNLPFDVKDEELYQLFCGLSQAEPNVEAVRVIRDPNTSIGKGIAYVLFKTREAANRVCKRRDLKIRDRNLRISHVRSDDSSSKLKENSAKDFPAAKGEKRKRADASDPSSYEGIRSSKTGVVKKYARTKSSPRDDSPRRPTQNNLQQYGRKKRPAVAARKSKQLLKRKQSSVIRTTLIQISEQEGSSNISF